MTNRSKSLELPVLSTWLNSPARFVKMHGSGNDFVLMDLRKNPIPEPEIRKLAVNMCSRHTGVGADGWIGIVQASGKEKHEEWHHQTHKSQPVSFEMIFKNPDGSDAGMCGNGARCFAVLVSVVSGQKKFPFLMGGNRYFATILEDTQSLRTKEHVPSMAEIAFPGIMRVDHQFVEGTDLAVVYSGTEHVVLRVDPQQLEDPAYVRKHGVYWRTHRAFAPVGTNVNFLTPAENNPYACRLRTFERGVENLTLSCGTGAIAAALAWHAGETLPEQPPISEISPFDSSYRDTSFGSTTHSSVPPEVIAPDDALEGNSRNTNGESEFKIQVEQAGGTVEVSFLFDKNTKTYRRIRLKGSVAFVFMAQNLF